MARYRKSPAVQQHAEHLAHCFETTPQPLTAGSAAALAALCLRWDCSPATAMQRALELAAVCSGALPGRDVASSKP